MQTKEICSLYTTSMLSTSTMTMTRLRPAARVLRSEPLPRGRVMIPQENNNKNITLLSTHHRRSLGCSLKRSHLLKCKWKEADNSDSPPSSSSAHSSTSNTTRSLSSTLLLSRMVCVEWGGSGPPYKGVERWFPGAFGTNLTSTALWDAREILAQRLGVNGTKGGSTEPVHRPNRPKARSPPPLAGGSSRLLLVQAHGCCTAWASNIPVLWTSLDGLSGPVRGCSVLSYFQAHFTFAPWNNTNTKTCGAG
jgi:hypothetical protein